MSGASLIREPRQCRGGQRQCVRAHAETSWKIKYSTSVRMVQERLHLHDMRRDFFNTEQRAREDMRVLSLPRDPASQVAVGR